MGAGAELANVVNEGALECARRGGDTITSLDIYNGIDRILQVQNTHCMSLRWHGRLHALTHSFSDPLASWNLLPVV